MTVLQKIHLLTFKVLHLYYLSLIIKIICLYNNNFVATITYVLVYYYVTMLLVCVPEIGNG